MNIDLWKRCQWWNIDKTTPRIRCDQFWFPEAQSRNTGAQNMCAYIFGRRIAVRGAQEEPWFKSAQWLLHTMSSPHQPNARSFARRVSEPLAVAHFSVEPSALCSSTAAWLTNTTTRIRHRNSKFAPLRKKRSCPAKLLLRHNDWVTERERTLCSQYG